MVYDPAFFIRRGGTERMDRIERLGQLYQKLKGSIFLRVRVYPGIGFSGGIKYEVEVAPEDVTFGAFVHKWLDRPAEPRHERIRLKGYSY
jgi:hypothetical protein